MSAASVDPGAPTWGARSSAALKVALGVAFGVAFGVAVGVGVGTGSAGTSQLLATEGEAKLIQFSDSSVIELRPYTTLRVSVVEGGAVVARLMQGALRANVHHHDRTDYRFQAGDDEV